MSQAIESYLDKVMGYANLRDADKATRVRAELRDHLLEKADVLTKQGTPREDAVFQTVEAHGPPSRVGYGLRPKFPLVDIRTVGTARGVVAIGPRAIGIFAFGGFAIGVFSLGGLSIGVVGMGGCVAALLLGWGGVALVPTGVAFAGLALGLVAIGGLPLGGWTAGGYPPATLFDRHQHLPAWIPFDPSNPYAWVISSVVIFAVFAPATILSNVAMFREGRRLRQSGVLAE